jgi:glucose/arabinose dehydrogenase
MDAPRILPSFVLFGALSAAWLSGCGGMGPAPNPSPGPPPTLTLSTVASGLSSPLDLEQPNDGTGRFFVVEQGGRIRILQNGSVLATPFLDISSKVVVDTEEGLLGVAFHPQFAQNGRYYVNYDRSGGPLGQQTVIAEYTVPAGTNVTSATTERILLVVDQPFTNHKAGQLAFGSDGFLYFGLGDGGSGNDPLGNGQNTQTLLGKMLRIDVNTTSAGKAYGVPADNPFVGGGGLPEIYAYGFRNPWRFSFDRMTGRLFCADVGQGRFEEVDLVTKGGNFGWSIMEGAHCLNGTTCNMTGLTLPIVEYDHSEGIAVIGGFVYRGSAIPSLAGTYVMGDFGSGTIWGVTENPPGTFTRTTLLSTGRSISSFGQDTSGELYVVDYSGSILKLVAQ